MGSMPSKGASTCSYHPRVFFAPAKRGVHRDDERARGIPMANSAVEVADHFAPGF